MPREKKMQTPSKEPESSSMTHEEEEQMLHDISKLQEQVQQMSRSQKLTEAKINGVEAKMNGMEAKMDNFKIDLNTNLKTGMEDLKTDLTNFLQEILTNGEKLVKETRDENKRNVNHDSIDANFGSKTHHIPKIDMRKFDGKDPATWILQMEQFFDLNNVQNTQKVRMETVYLEPNQFVWYQWLCSRKQFITWAIFMEELITHYEDTKSNTFFSQLISLKQKGAH